MIAHSKILSSSLFFVRDERALNEVIQTQDLRIQPQADSDNSTAVMKWLSVERVRTVFDASRMLHKRNEILTPFSIPRRTAYRVRRTLIGRVGVAYTSQ